MQIENLEQGKDRLVRQFLGRAPRRPVWRLFRGAIADVELRGVSDTIEMTAGTSMPLPTGDNGRCNCPDGVTIGAFQRTLPTAGTLT